MSRTDLAAGRDEEQKWQLCARKLKKQLEKQLSIKTTLLALLMLSWKKALLVLGCLILTEILGTYVLNPILLKKGLDVSVIEIMISVMVWGFLLGPAGVILAVPLTLALRRFIDNARMSTEPQISPAAP